MPALLIAIFAALISLGSFIHAYVTGRRTRMPLLQFMWESGQTGSDPKWWLVNVGTGPAANVLVAQTQKTALTPGLNGEVWYNPVLVPSIPVGGKLALTWLGGTMGLECGLGASYTDADRHFYTTKCGDDVSMFFIGLHLPRWPLLRLNGQKWVKTWWGVEDLSGPQWSAASDGCVTRSRWLPRRFGLSRSLGGWADPVRTFYVAQMQP
jgi:hypothetical protein